MDVIDLLYEYVQELMEQDRYGDAYEICKLLVEVSKRGY